MYVTHGGSLGAAREAILRKLVKAETPGPFKVKTGLIRRQEGDEPKVSNQCDLLVYNPHKDPPLYRVDDFVVVSSRAAAAVVEVKSCMEQQEFNEIMEVWKGACQLNVPVLGFAYDGVTFGTFLEYVDAQMRIPHRGPTVQAPPSIRFLPECIAVHSRNYVGFRCQDLEGRYRARRYFALSFGEAPAAALAFFFRLYALWLGEPGSAAEGKLLYEFNTMPDIIDKRWLAPGGEWQRGPAPED